MSTTFSPVYVYGKTFRRSRHVTPKRIVWSGPKLNSSKILYLSSLSASLKKIRSKLKVLSCPQHFPHYKYMWGGNQSFDPICPKTLAVFPHPIKCYQDWPTGLRDIQVWKCGRGMTDNWQRTDGGPLLYYKLTLCAYGSGELKRQWSGTDTI